MLKSNHISSLRSLWEYKLNTKTIPNQEDGNSIVDSAIKHADILFPYMKIPNAGKFKVTELPEYHPILRREEIKKRISPASIEITKLSSDLSYMNNYLDKMFRLLNNSRNNPQKFWNIAKILLFNSVSFRVSCIIKIYPTWYKTESLKFIKQLIKEYNNLDFSAFNFKK